MIARQSSIKGEQLELDFDQWAMTDWFNHHGWNAKQFKYYWKEGAPTWVVVAYQKTYEGTWRAEIYNDANTFANVKQYYATEEECRRGIEKEVKTLTFTNYVKRKDRTE